MKSVFPFLLLFLSAVVTSCSGSSEEKEVIKELKTHKEKLSYAFGLEQAAQLTQGPNFTSFDIPKVIEGFESGMLNYKQDPTKECQPVLKKVFGEHGQDFNAGMAKEASDCFGKMIGASFMNVLKSINGIDRVSVPHVIQGFKDKLEGKTVLMQDAEKNKLMQEFMQELNELSSKDMVEQSKKFLDDAKKLPNTKLLESGIIIQTIKEGVGSSPKATDDVMADYILTNAKGDTMESSFKIKEMNGGPTPSFNLSGVIQGWTLGFQQLKKGGKYKLFVPSELAYNQGALCFYIEFIDFGPAGTLAKQ